MTKTFIQLAKRCVNRELSDQLSGAAVNLTIDLKYGIEVLAAVTATAQFRGRNEDPLDLFLPRVKTVPEELRPFCTARAIELLREWNVKIDDAFRKHVIHWVKGYNSLPGNAVQYIRNQIDYAWSEHTIFEHPFSYWGRLGHKSPFGAAKSFGDIQRELLEMCPKTFDKPYED